MREFTSGVGYRYDLHVTGVVDRRAWAEVVQEILDAECHGNRSEFARRVVIDGRPMSPRTVYSWLRSEADVKESSVRAVAEAFKLNSVELLIRVGFLTREQFPTFPSEVIDEEQRAVIDRDDLDAESKAAILRALDEMRQTDEDALRQQRDRLRQYRDDRIALLIERARRAS